MSILSKLTMKAVFDHCTTAYADRPALSFVNGTPMTFAEFGEKVAELRSLYHYMGVRRGDKVVLLSESMPNWGVSYYAAVTMGAVAVPVLQEFHESAVHHIVDHCEAKLAVVSERFMDKIAEGDFDRLLGIIRMDDLTAPPEDGLKGKVLEAVRNGRARMEKLTGQARKLAKMDTLKDVKIEEDDIACIIYTSGTTGHSKGVVLSHKNIVSNAQTASNMVDIGDHDKMVSVLPLAHTYECTFGLTFPLMQGCGVYYLEKPPSPRTLLPAMAKIRPTFLVLVPLVMEKIYKNRVKPKLTGSPVMRTLTKIGKVKKLLHKVAVKKLMASFGGRIKLCCFGGAPLAPEVEEFLRNGGFPYAVGFGLSEASPLVSGCAPHQTKFKSCGPAIDGVSIRIADANPETGIGEIQLKGPNVMLEYYKAPKVTKETFDDGWLKTGDLGILDEDGYLFIRGRSKNMVLGPSGENIYPEEIESILNQHEFVLESLVYRQEGKLTARVHLNYELLEKTLGTKKMIESEVYDKVQKVLAMLKKETNAMVASFSRIIQIIEHTEPFEKTPTHKIKRYLYVDPAENGMPSN